MIHPHHPQYMGNALLGISHGASGEGQHDLEVCVYGIVVKEPEILKDRADTASVGRYIRSLYVRQLSLIDLDLSGIRLDLLEEHPYESGLAAPALTCDKYEFSSFYTGIKVTEYRSF